MTQRKSLARKLIVLFIVLVILIPCSVLVYDTVVSSNEERVDFYLTKHTKSCKIKNA